MKHLAPTLHPSWLHRDSRSDSVAANAGGVPTLDIGAGSDRSFRRGRSLPASSSPAPASLSDGNVAVYFPRLIDHLREATPVEYPPRCAHWVQHDGTCFWCGHGR